MSRKERRKKEEQEKLMFKATMIMLVIAVLEFVINRAEQLIEFLKK